MDAHVRQHHLFIVTKRGSKMPLYVIDCPGLLEQCPRAENSNSQWLKGVSPRSHPLWNIGRRFEDMYQKMKYL